MEAPDKRGKAVAGFEITEQNPVMRFLVSVFLALAFFSAAMAEGEKKAPRPNIILILCDDLGYADLSCYGSKRCSTPVLDQLAAEGIRFTDFYSAYCVCSASRAALLTGCYSARIGMPGVIGPHAPVGLNPTEYTIPEVLKTVGYRSAAIGKWHVGDSLQTVPTRQGFDSYFGMLYSNDMARRGQWKNVPGDLDRIWKNQRWDAFANELYRNEEVIEAPVDQTTLTSRYTDQALQFIEENAKEGPFFLYFASSMPHVPLFVPSELFDPDPHKAYPLTIKHIDQCVGRIVDKLNECNIAENTMVVFTSDNGPWLIKQHHAGSAEPLRAGKATTYEGGMRVPCIIRWPAKIKSSQVCRGVVSAIDLLPTFAALAGAELPPQPIDGLDVGVLFETPNATSPRDKEGFIYYRRGLPVGIRLGRWKLRRVRVDLKIRSELYDLESDVGEDRNVAREYPEIVDALKEKMERYHNDLKATRRDPWRASQ